MPLTAYRLSKGRVQRAGSLESLVDATAYVSLALGWGLAAMLCMVLIANELVLQGLCLGIVLIVSSGFSWLLLRCLAEHLRLQKRIAGLDYAGRISSGSEEMIYACSNCGQMLHSKTRCDGCHAALIDEPTEDDEGAGNRSL